MSDDQYSLPALTSKDRCDKRQCSAPALVRVVTPSGDLDFCGHHYALAEHAIKPVASYIQDERGNGPRVDTRLPLEDDGRMFSPEGIRYVDPCRWCMGRLESTTKPPERFNAKRAFLCPSCDQSAANMDDWLIDDHKKG